MRCAPTASPSSFALEKIFLKEVKDDKEKRTQCDVTLGEDVMRGR